MGETNSVSEMLTVSKPETVDSSRLRHSSVRNCRMFSSELGGALINRKALKGR